MKHKASSSANVTLESPSPNGSEKSRPMPLANGMILSVRVVPSDAIIPIISTRGRGSTVYQPLIDQLATLALGYSLELTLDDKRIKNVVSQVRQKAEALRTDGGVLSCVRTGENSIALSFKIPPKEQKKGVEGARQSVETVTKRYGAVKHESID